MMFSPAMWDTMEHQYQKHLTVVLDIWHKYSALGWLLNATYTLCNNFKVF